MKCCWTGVLVLLMAMSGCSREPAATAGAQAAGGQYTVVCTTAMIADIVRSVAGDRARVETLIGEGVDPHLYKPTRNDVAALQSADVVFYNGLLLEGKMTDVLVQVASRGKPVHPVTQNFDESHLIHPPELQGHADPHVWMDASLWRLATASVVESLSAFDPEHADRYRAAGEHYGQQLDKLHAYVGEVIRSIPEQQRVLVTAHDAFHYFGRAYGIEVRGIQGISTESEAGLDDINRLVDYLVERKVQAVFVETSVADKNVQALIEGARARGRTVRIGARLFSDAMGAPGTYEGTYIGMMDSNATAIARALGGKPPPGGLNGRLKAD